MTAGIAPFERQEACGRHRLVAAVDVLQRVATVSWRRSSVSIRPRALVHSRSGALRYSGTAFVAMNCSSLVAVGPM